MNGSSSRPHRPSYQLQLEVLEHRVLLDASGVLAIQPHDGIAAYVSNQAMLVSEEMGPPETISELEGNPRFVGDVDGDGRDDIVHAIDGEWTVSQAHIGGDRCQDADTTVKNVAELPRECVDTSFEPELGSKLIFVAPDDDLQAAIDDARPGDIIELEAGATYRGSFTLGPKSGGDDWIHIRSSRHAELPGSGTRIDPAKHAHLMPKIVTSGAGSLGIALHFLPGANHYRLEGIELTSDYQGTVNVVDNLVLLQAFGVQDAAELPHHITFDRMYIHGNPTGNVLNGIRMGGRHIAVIDSYLSDFHAIGRESHAVYAADGAGPIKIVNNHLEAAGVNVLFGGDDPEVHGLVNQDIEIRRNLLTKREEWRDGPWPHKYLLEFKNARRVLASENILENAWLDGRFSLGKAVLIQPVNQQGACHWCVAEDITLSNNILRNVSVGFQVAGQTLWEAERGQRILIENNLLYDLDQNAPGGGLGTPFLITEDFDDVVIVHNTVSSDGRSAIGLGSSLSPARKGISLVVRDNLISHNQYGAKGDGSGVGIASFDDWVEEYTFTNNVFYDAGSINPELYPGNVVTQNVEFLNPDVGDFRLASSSPYNNAATDGSDIGVNFERLQLAWCAERGACSTLNHLTQSQWGTWSTDAVWEDILIADVTGDGMDDIVGRADGNWWVGRSTGQGFVNEQWGQWSNDVVWEDVMAADVNADGKLDIVGRTGGVWWVAESQGDAFYNKIWTRWEPGDWQDVRTLDVDANGTGDVVGRLDGQWILSRQIGQNVVTQPWARWSNSVQWEDVLIADVNGDSQDDIVGRADGDWWVTLSQGSDTRTEKWGAWSDLVEWKHVQIADVNADGREDIVGQAAGTWWVALAESLGFDSKNWGNWAHSLQLEEVLVADINGDGKDDLVGLVEDNWFSAISGAKSLIY